MLNAGLMARGSLAAFRKQPMHGMLLMSYVRDGEGGGGSVSSANVTFLSIPDLRPRPLARPGQPQLADR